eukprot:TRINITY_DN621_c0_g1_i1.p1 TRINITY_DN621_c0_g1~~TRINITY_DN621_c0_g1_i1.p1  ORF type:complete len:118 (-),score=32.24 TRINITY_DN621_c0_g1_i1:148-501(-)
MSKQEEREFSEGEIKATYKELQQEYNAIAGKIAELEGESNEHNLVIDTISKLEKDRKCFRMIGGVLVERTVGEVLPAVIKNRDGMNEIIGQMKEDLRTKNKDMNEFAQKYQLAGGRQ